MDPDWRCISYYFLLKTGIFHCYVSLPEGSCLEGTIYGKDLALVDNDKYHIPQFSLPSLHSIATARCCLISHLWVDCVLQTFKCRNSTFPPLWYTPPKLTNDNGKTTMNEDVFPFEHGDFPARHVSFQGCIFNSENGQGVLWLFGSFCWFRKSPNEENSQQKPSTCSSIMEWDTDDTVTCAFFAHEKNTPVVESW